MSQIIGNDFIVFVDCDDTLCMWVNPDSPSAGAVEFIEPYTKSTLYLHPHFQHIELIKKYKQQGYTVIVWSAGGSLWAKEVVDKLGISDDVDFVMSKSIKFVDDLPANEVLVGRVYIPYRSPNGSE